MSTSVYLPAFKPVADFDVGLVKSQCLNPWLFHHSLHPLTQAKNLESPTITSSLHSWGSNMSWPLVLLVKYFAAMHWTICPNSFANQPSKKPFHECICRLGRVQLPERQADTCCAFAKVATKLLTTKTKSENQDKSDKSIQKSHQITASCLRSTEAAESGSKKSELPGLSDSAHLCHCVMLWLWVGMCQDVSSDLKCIDSNLATAWPGLINRKNWIRAGCWSPHASDPTMSMRQDGRKPLLALLG